MRNRVIESVGFFICLLSFLMAGTVFADVAQIKAYKTAFPDEKPACVDCHVDKTPKKDDGMHDLNAYGAKVKKIKEAPDAESYKAAGKAE